MTRPRNVTVRVRLPRKWVRYLKALDAHDAADVGRVLEQIADHAFQGVIRPGAWERGWVCRVFGEAWLERMEPDPEVGHHERPRRRRAGARRSED
jgi:hypothetical protein